MNYTEHKFTLDVSKTVSQVSLSVKKGDTARRLLISLKENGYPYYISSDCYAAISATKPDGHLILNNCSIESNVIGYDFTPQTVAAVGIVNCEVVVYGAGGLQLTSASFDIIVEDTIYHDGDEIESSDEFSLLTDLISRNQELMLELEKLINSGGGGGSGGGGAPGKDGFSPIANVTETDSGAVITITDAEGTTTATVLHGHDGIDGTAGKTPKKGEDYYTEAEKQEIIEEVLGQIPEGGGGAAERPTVSEIDLSNFENGSFSEVVNGRTITHAVTFDAYGRSIEFDGVTIKWG